MADRKLVRWYHIVAVLVGVSTLAGSIFAAASRLEAHFATKEELQAHAQLEDVKLEALAAKLSDEISDKVVRRLRGR